MSKTKKERADRSTTTISEKDIAFEKLIQYAGVMFLISLSIFMLYYLIVDVILNTVEIEIGSMQFSFIIFTGISATLCFALSTKIKKNREIKRKIFIDWLVAEFLFCMFAIFSVAVYQW
ncbi:MAG: hypothetical protein GF383_07445 [Candidatus Lokiarchaeota archaeon]|nr:hypothetical protein [Candidatus Lokiarchaeota archaeon]MBD3340023.1 hypothetical protein [Candidatus Lokiarchaeota archaeon]